MSTHALLALVIIAFSLGCLAGFATFVTKEHALGAVIVGCGAMLFSLLLLLGILFLSPSCAGGFIR